MNIRTCFSIITVLIILGAAPFCTQPLNVAGGGSGTEISGRVIQGTVRDSAQQPVSGGTARLRPFDYLASVPVEDTAQKQDISITANGTFSFENVPVGHYIIECTYEDSFSLALDCVIDSLDSLSILPDITLQPMAVISGNNIHSEQSQDHPVVEVRGLERSIEVNDEGDFQMMVPAGWRRLHISGVPDMHPDTLVYFSSGERKEFTRENPDLPQLCDDMECELAIVKDLFDSNGITSVEPESVVVITDAWVTELDLREMGITVLPASLGNLQHLEVLDISSNEIEELPSTIENLRRLKFLKADHNKFWSIPASISALDSLELIDFAFNKLQTLPEPITYLSPDKAFFGFNMLCNIGEMTKMWLSKVDPEWNHHQDCY